MDIYQMIMLAIIPTVILVIASLSVVRYSKETEKISKMTDEIEKGKAEKASRKMIIYIATVLVVGSLLMFYCISNINTVISIDKPIIYLYPETEQEVLLKLGYKDKVTVSYPKYEKGWRVLAQPNGDLLDLDTNKNLYALYYESKNGYDFKVEEDGFVVKGEDTASFLEEKLKILGLNYKEAEEFIVYWLPKLEKNNYNYIRFASPEELEKNMPLNITPAPDTRIRILMTYKGLKTPIKVQEQTLIPMERSGFIAVEWGGTEID